MNTPITDASAGYEDGSGCWKYKPSGELVYADLARQLERDRARLLEVVNAFHATLTPISILSNAQEQAHIMAADALASLEIKDKP